MEADIIKNGDSDNYKVFACNIMSYNIINYQQYISSRINSSNNIVGSNFELSNVLLLKFQLLFICLLVSINFHSSDVNQNGAGGAPGGR